MPAATLSMYQTRITADGPAVDLLGVMHLEKNDVGLAEYYIGDWRFPADKIQRMPSYRSKDGAEITHFHIGTGGLIAELIVPK